MPREFRFNNQHGLCTHGVSFDEPCAICAVLTNAFMAFHADRCEHGVSFAAHCPECSAKIAAEIKNSQDGVEFLEEQARIYDKMALDYRKGHPSRKEFEVRAAKLRAEALLLAEEIYAMSE